MILGYILLGEVPLPEVPVAKEVSWLAPSLFTESEEVVQCGDTVPTILVPQQTY